MRGVNAKKRHTRKMAKIACAMITWGDQNGPEDMRRTLTEMKSCGYDGAEIGISDMELIGGIQTLEEIGIRLVSVHTGFDLRSTDGETEIAKMKEYAPKAASLGAEFVFVSNSYYAGKGADDYHAEAKLYNDLGKVVREAGLTFCFHNHHWEFKKNRLGLNILTGETDPAYVALVPDLGWVMRGDMEPVDFLREFGDRVKALHFKEFTFDEQFTELGKGVVDLKTAYEYIKHRNLWIIAEQDTCKGSPLDSARQNVAYIRSLDG